MRALTASQLLELWEKGHASLPMERAVSLLAAASPDTPRELVEMLSIGRRDALLLQLREQVFGSELVMTTACPCCGQVLEMDMPTSALKTAVVPEEKARVALQDYLVSFRLPNSRDLAVCVGFEPAQSRRMILSRCIEEASGKGQPVAVEELSDTVLNEVEERIAAMDAQAEVLFDFECAECGEKWKQIFDVVSFFWTEIDAWARRILLEVNVLARAYGWCESDVLTMSPARRQIYIAMAQG